MGESNYTYHCYIYCSETCLEKQQRIMGIPQLFCHVIQGSLGRAQALFSCLQICQCCIRLIFGVIPAVLPLLCLLLYLTHLRIAVQFSVHSQRGHQCEQMQRQSRLSVYVALMRALANEQQ